VVALRLFLPRLAGEGVNESEARQASLTLCLPSPAREGRGVMVASRATALFEFGAGR
jgi:hypothetical protein